MIDHITLWVQNLARSRAFYMAALAPLGYEVIEEHPGALGMGANKAPDLWLAEDPANTRAMHLALRAPDRGAVRAFHAAALAAGGKDNGAPGLRPHYHPNYYAAFVLDEDGHNLEVVIHRPE